MRRVVAAEYVTVDGVMTDPGGVGELERGGWSNRYFNDELAKYQSDKLFASDALLLGRVTFEGFAAAWPSQEEAEGAVRGSDEHPSEVCRLEKPEGTACLERDAAEW